MRESLVFHFWGPHSWELVCGLPYFLFCDAVTGEASDCEGPHLMGPWWKPQGPTQHGRVVRVRNNLRNFKFPRFGRFVNHGYKLLILEVGQGAGGQSRLTRFRTEGHLRSGYNFISNHLDIKSHWYCLISLHLIIPYQNIFQWELIMPYSLQEDDTLIWNISLPINYISPLLNWFLGILNYSSGFYLFD